MEHLPGVGRAHPRGPVPRLGGRRRPGRHRTALPPLRLHLPAAGDDVQGGGARPAPRRPGWCAPTSTSCTRTRIRRGRRGAGRGWPPPRPGSPPLPEELPTVLVNHWPVVREPTRPLWYPDFALWCGTEATADWPRRFRAAAVVYGHLHIPRLLAGRRAPSGGVARLSAGVAAPRRRARPPGPDPARTGHGRRRQPPGPSHDRQAAAGPGRDRRGLRRRRRVRDVPRGVGAGGRRRAQATAGVRHRTRLRPPAPWPSWASPPRPCSRPQPGAAVAGRASSAP